MRKATVLTNLILKGYLNLVRVGDVDDVGDVGDVENFQKFLRSKLNSIAPTLPTSPTRTKFKYPFKMHDQAFRKKYALKSSTCLM